MLIVRGTGILGRNRFRCCDQLMLDGGIGALDERKRDELCEVDRAGRSSKRKARFRDVHVQLLPDALAYAVDRGLDVRLDIARKRCEKLLLDRPRMRPVLEADQPGIWINQLLARSVGEEDRLGL